MLIKMRAPLAVRFSSYPSLNRVPHYIQALLIVQLESKHPWSNYSGKP
jgi:hypothetical protein